VNIQLLVYDFFLGINLQAYFLLMHLLSALKLLHLSPTKLLNLLLAFNGKGCSVIFTFHYQNCAKRFCLKC